MTVEEFTRATSIMEEIDSLSKKKEIFAEREARYNDYIDFVNNEKITKVEFAGKTYKKVDVKFYLNENPTVTDLRDMFDIVDENKDDFIAFLKKCQSNCKKMIKSIDSRIVELKSEFAELGTIQKAA